MSYPRRLESLTVCRCHYKSRTFASVIYFKDPKCGTSRGLKQVEGDCRLFRHRLLSRRFMDPRHPKDCHTVNDPIYVA